MSLLSVANTAQLGSAPELLLIPDLLAAWLSRGASQRAQTRTPPALLDVDSRTWGTTVLYRLEKAARTELSSRLPRLVEPGTIVGSLPPELGWGDGRVVAVASHDSASAITAVPMADPEHAACVSTGTWSLVGAELTAPVRTEASRATNVTYELGVDGTVRDLKNVAGVWLLT